MPSEMQTLTQTQRSRMLPFPFISAFVGGMCLLAYLVPHRRTRFSPPDGSSTNTQTVWSWTAPAFEHVGPFHLLFNLFWLYELGPLLETGIAKNLATSLATPAALLPPLFTLAIYAVVVVASNAAQYLATGPNFLGLSGLVFGLVGFLAVAFPRAMIPGTVRFFAVWFVVCVVLTSLNILPVANAAHGVGAATGAFLGLLWRIAHSTRQSVSV